MVADSDMKDTPAVRCCLEVDQPQKKGCHKTVSTCLAVCSRSGYAPRSAITSNMILVVLVHGDIQISEPSNNTETFSLTNTNAT